MAWLQRVSPQRQLPEELPTYRLCMRRVFERLERRSTATKAEPTGEIRTSSYAAMRNACRRLTHTDPADLHGVSHAGGADSEPYESGDPCALLPSVTFRRGHLLSRWPVRRGATAAAATELMLTIMSLRAGQRSIDRPHDRTAAAHVGRR